jgi:polyisoprenoid-binding protein YceI
MRRLLIPIGVVLLVAAASAQSGPTSSATQGEPLRLVVAPEGNEARYRVNEQLVGVDLPSDAVGRTTTITGGLTLDETGTVMQDRSRIVIDLTTLQSDVAMRDRYIQRRTLETEAHPTAEFVPLRLTGLSFPLPTTGQFTFEIVGELTLHGVTQEVSWKVTAERVGNTISGAAQTRTTFGAWGLTIPRVMRVISVKDDILLEYDFRFLIVPPGGQ